MKYIKFLILAGLILGVGLYLSIRDTEDTIDTDIEYTCAMHPEVRMPRPAKCPKCSMELIPRKKAQPMESLILTDRQIQHAGVRYGQVKRRKLQKLIETTGRLTYDETRLKRVTSWSGGRIEKLHIGFAGDFVRKGELLAEIYSPRLLFAIDELAVAIKTYERLKGRQDASPEILKQERDTIQSNKNLLRRLGLTDQQVVQIVEKILEGKDPYPKDRIPTIPIYSPLDGVVVCKLKEQGAYVSEGDEILHIADLGVLWIYIDIYEYELPFVRLGQDVEIIPRAYNRSFLGKIIYIDPFLQPATRTIRVRCEIDNSDLLLKPDMYARAIIHADLPEMLSVPADAVLLSGLRDVVILKEGPGRFRPVEVRLGRKWLYPQKGEQKGRGLGYFEGYERYHEVLAGLGEGDLVVTSGAFLLNSEANFQRVITKMLPPPAKEEKLPEEIRRLNLVVDKILGVYFKIAGHLANDKAEPVVQLAKELARLSLKEPKLAQINKVATELATPPSSIKKLRENFSYLSKHLLGYVREFMKDRIKNRQIFIFGCAMVPTPFKQWLQDTPEIANPYFGSQMLRCGIRLEQ
jgi:Cu(I)/Ag(I) efflux system membrane fusion protein